MTLTFELGLDILPLDLHAKIQVCMSVRSSVRARHTHTHTQTDHAKTTTPDAKTTTSDASLTRGVTRLSTCGLENSD